MTISSFIQTQVPAEYAENSPKFVDFLKQYYNWLENNETTGNLTNYQKMVDDFNITTVSEENFPAFVNTYLTNLPKDTRGNIRILLKHALDLYRSKGTLRSFKLFFRALFDVDVDLYVPNRDILHTSDSEWFLPQYLEVSALPLRRIDSYQDFVNQQVIGEISRATAVISSYEVKFVNNKHINVLQISNVVGSFLAGERFDILNNMNFSDSPTIAGSLNYIAIQSSGNGFQAGDIVQITGESNKATGKVAATRSENGRINFVIQDGGSGFSENTIINVIGAAPGSTFRALIDFNDTLEISATIIEPMLNTPLETLRTVAINPLAVDRLFLDAPFDDIFGLSTINVGSIVGVESIQAGSPLVDNVQVTVRDPLIARLAQPDGRGKLLGDNATILGQLRAGESVAAAISIVSSGYGFTNGERVTFTREDNTQGTGVAIVNSQGVGEGYWTTESSHLNDKKLQDGYYYQQHSYELQSKLDASVYRDAFKLLQHPSGLKLFTKYQHKEAVNNNLQVITSLFQSDYVETVPLNDYIYLRDGSRLVDRNGDPFVFVVGDTVPSNNNILTNYFILADGSRLVDRNGFPINYRPEPPTVPVPVVYANSTAPANSNAPANEG